MTHPLQTSPQGLRFAVIGLGRMGMRHIEAAQSLGMVLVGGADIAAPAREALMQAHGLDGAACPADGLAMLAHVRPDALVVATTAPSHAPFVRAAAAGGVRHILCEKPMASSLAEGQAMLEACTASGSSLAINHQMRFMEQYTRVRDLIGSAQMGPLASILVAGSNFGLAMNASHYFEMFRYVAGEPVAEVQAWFEPGTLANPRGPQFDDASGRVLARSASGVALYLDFSAQAGWGVTVTYICRNGQITVDELRGAMRVVARQADHRALPTTRYGMPVDVTDSVIAPADVIAPTAAVWAAMLGGAAYPDGAAGLHALRCLVAAHASHRSGRMLRLDDPSLPVDEIFNWA